MSKRIVVQGDKVTGTDKHNVAGTGTISAPPGTAAYTGIGDFEYDGTMTDALSSFVSIQGKPLATTASKSSLGPEQKASPSGKHAGPSGKNLLPPTPTPIPSSLSISDPIGTGVPGQSAGSTFVKVGGDPVLLHDDVIDTCDGLSIPGNSKVAASGQELVSSSE